jgi:Uma2 family endonuclease
MVTGIAMATTTTMSGAAFDQLPYEELHRWELLRGELIVVPSKTPRHQIIVGTLFASLDKYLDHEHLGVTLPNCEFALGENDRLSPDVAFLSMERWDSIDPDKTPIPLAPDISLEVITPSELATHGMLRIETYFAAGTREVWRFAPGIPWIEVFRNRKLGVWLDTNDTLDTPLLPGWEIPVSKVFNVRRGGRGRS